MILKETFKSDENGATCLICKTSHSIGKTIYPNPKCNCGNLIFDITPYYVRILINWNYVLVENKDNWEVEILNQIKLNGKPTHVKNNINNDERFSLAMQNVDRNDIVSREEIMKIYKKILRLYEPQDFKLYIL